MLKRITRDQTLKNVERKKKSKSSREAELDLFLKKIFPFSIKMG